MLAAEAFALVAGLVVFALGLSAFVFPRAVADGIGDRLGRPTGHRAMVATRTAGLAGMAAGVVLLLL